MQTDQLPTLIDRLGEAALDCRAAVREAHEAMADMRQLMKEARRVSDEVTAGAVNGRLEAAVDQGLDEYKGAVEEAMEAAVAKIQREFDKLANSYGCGPQNHALADDLLPRARDQRRRVGGP